MTHKSVGCEGRSPDLTCFIPSHLGPENGVVLELPERDAARETASFECGRDPRPRIRRWSAPGNRACGALKGRR